MSRGSPELLEVVASMANSNRILAEPLLQEARPCSARRSCAVLMALSLLIGVAFAVYATRIGEDGQGRQPIIAMFGLPKPTSTGSRGAVNVGPRLAPFPPGQNSRRQIQPVQASLKETNEGLKAASGVVTPLLKGLYAAQAPIQAKVLGTFGGPSEEEVRAEIDSTIKTNPAVIYSYPLSPFCTEAIALLESTGCKFTKIEPGQEWFLLGPKGSAIRAELGQMTGQTSFPHIFIKGQSVGGLFSGGPGGSGITGLAESGELLTMLKQAGAC